MLPQPLHGSSLNFLWYSCNAAGTTTVARATFRKKSCMFQHSYSSVVSFQKRTTGFSKRGRRYGIAQVIIVYNSYAATATHAARNPSIRNTFMTPTLGRGWTCETRRWCGQAYGLTPKTRPVPSTSLRPSDGAALFDPQHYRY